MSPDVKLHLSRRHFPSSRRLVASLARPTAFLFYISNAKSARGHPHRVGPGRSGPEERRGSAGDASLGSPEQKDEPLARRRRRAPRCQPR